MSKYYKAEDVIRKRAEDLADTSYWEYGNPKNVDEWIEVAEMEFKDLPTIDIVTCKDCKRCEKELVIERRVDGKETIVNLCNKTSPPTIVPLDFYCKDGAKMKGADNE